MAQLMPLPLTVSCFSKIQIGFTFLVPAHLGSHGKRAITWVCVIAETEEELINRLNEWKDNVESKGMRVTMNKTKVMISGERQMVRQKAVRWPCRVCSKGVGSNSIPK